MYSANCTCDFCYGVINTRTLRCGRCGRQYYWSTRYVGLLVDWYTLLKEGAYDKK